MADDSKRKLICEKHKDFINKYCDGSQQKFNYLHQWEKSPEYERLINIMLAEHSANDLLEIYNIVRENAKKGDDKAIKTYLILNKEIKNNIKVEKVKQEPEQEQEEDGLILE